MPPPPTTTLSTTRHFFQRQVARSSARFIEMLGPAGASPSMLERIVLSNVLNTDVFGSAIAFEPGECAAPRAPDVFVHGDARRAYVRGTCAPG